MSIPTIPPQRETDITVTREFAAPRERVWDAWFNPTQLAAWFGPTDVEIDPASVVVDAQPGGRWDLDMVTPDGANRYPLRAVLRALHEPDYFEGFVEAASEGEISDVTLRVWFEDAGEKTRVIIHQGPFAPEHREPTVDGWESSFTKLDALLAAP